MKKKNIFGCFILTLLIGIAIGAAVTTELSKSETLQPLNLEKFDFSRIEDEDYVFSEIKKAEGELVKKISENRLKITKNYIKNDEIIIEYLQNIYDALPADSDLEIGLSIAINRHKQILESDKVDRDSYIYLLDEMEKSDDLESVIYH